MQDNQSPEVVVTDAPEIPPVAVLSKKEKFLKEVKSFTFIILSVLIFRSVLFEPFKIEGIVLQSITVGSMFSSDLPGLNNITFKNI